MIGSIERIRRYARRSGLLTVAPMMLLVGVGSPAHPDPIKHTGPVTGTGGGVLPIPAAPVPASRSTRLDSLLSGHHDNHVERGRVLYAPGHAPRDTASAAHPARKHQCPMQRVMAQTHPVAGPNT